jgi:hypothetical protein
MVESPVRESSTAIAPGVVAARGDNEAAANVTNVNMRNRRWPRVTQDGTENNNIVYAGEVKVNTVASSAHNIRKSVPARQRGDVSPTFSPAEAGGPWRPRRRYNVKPCDVYGCWIRRNGWAPTRTSILLLATDLRRHISHGLMTRRMGLSRGGAYWGNASVDPVTLTRRSIAVGL